MKFAGSNKLSGANTIESAGSTTPPPGYPVVVQTASGRSEPIFVTPRFDSIGLFTAQDGCGQAATRVVRADGTTFINNANASASPGDYIEIYGTGFGDVYFPPPDGMAATSVEPLSRLVGGNGITLGLPGFRQVFPPRLDYAGRVPGLAGVDQINFQIPQDAPEGCAIPVRALGVTISQPVTLSIRRGGGQCQDPPPASLGMLRWTRTLTSGPESAVQNIQETFRGPFPQASENLLISSGPDRESLCSCNEIVRQAGPACSNIQPKQLSAGLLTIENGSGMAATLPFSPTSDDGYSTSLSSGSMTGRRLGVSAAGGSDVGPFVTTVTSPPPIQITTPLPPGTVISNNQPFRVTWTNGSTGAIVRMHVIRTTLHWETDLSVCAMHLLPEVRLFCHW